VIVFNLANTNTVRLNRICSAFTTKRQPIDLR